MAESSEFDFFSLLPLDVVENITEMLPVPDVLRCLSVCKAWYRSLSRPELASFWNRACEHAGLPDYWLRTAMLTKTTYDLFHTAREHRAHICAIAPEVKAFGGSHPFESTLKSEYAGNGYFVKTIDYPTLDHEETVIGQLCTETGEITRVDTVPESCGEIQWATMTRQNVVWYTAKGVLHYYNVETRDSGELYRGRLLQEYGDTVNHCKRCFLFLIAGTDNSLHGYSWTFHFLKFDPDSDMPTRHRCTVAIPSGITQFVPRPIKAHFLPDDETCRSHRIVVQGGTGACVFRVEETADGLSMSPKPIATLNPFKDDKVSTPPVMVVNTTSEMTMSYDSRLVGMVTSVVYPHVSGLCLHIFNLNTYQQQTSVKVDWKEGSFNDTEVLAVNSLYAILGVSHSTGIVKVVEARTGKILLQRKGLSRGLPPVIPMARLLFIHYQGVYNEETLLDINSPLQLIILFRRGVNNIEGLFFHPFPKLPALDQTSDKELEASDDADQEM